jgi:long-chain fatty acid transport protein
VNVKYRCEIVPFNRSLGWMFALLCCLGGPAEGAGITIMEQSVKELGQAFSGASTNIDDASAVFFNPGAMGGLHGSLLSFAGYVVIPSTEFQNDGSRLAPQLGGTPLLGGEGGNGGVTTLIPNFYAVHELTQRLVLGLGVNAPFGVHSRFEPGWQGRYQALDSEIRTVNINPSLAVRINDALSFGVGFDVQYLDAKLTNAIDFGSVCLATLGPSACLPRGLLPQRADGHVKLQGDSVGVGYNLGMLYALGTDTRIGVSYRSGIHHDIEGDADYSVPSAALPLTQSGRFMDTGMHAPVDLPDTVSFGVYHRFHPHWAVTADALWTNWSRIRQLAVKFSSAQPDSVLPLDWRDTWRIAVGASYEVTPAATFRLGVAYDQSPIPGASRRIPRIPDSDRVWLTAGVSFHPFERITMHGGYAHLFFRDAPAKTVGQTGELVAGRFSNEIDIVGLQLDWQF